MASINSAVIYSPSLPQENQRLFSRDIAGVGLLKRLVLTLQRAGVDELVIFCDGIPEKERSCTEKDITSDPRFKGKLLFVSQEDLTKQEEWERIDEFIGGRRFLLVDGNLIATTSLVKAFVDTAQKSAALDQGGIVALSSAAHETGEMYLMSPEKLKVLQNPSRNPSGDEPIERITLDGPGFFWKSVSDASSARIAESGLIKAHRYAYTQFMDFWFNSLLSAPISSFLVKLPVTPNQITLFGLLIGLLAGVFFAQGNHAAEFIGAIFLAATAVWDCCDGEVARLKFMESDFGETLDTICDNIINIFIFTGMMIGVAKQHGMVYAVTPFTLLVFGGGMIFSLIYFKKEEKGSVFKGTWAYEVIQILASRNFIYIILLFAVFGRLDVFLWLAGIGSTIFAMALFFTKKNILRENLSGGQQNF